MRERLSVKSGRLLGDGGFRDGTPDTQRAPAQEIQVNGDSMPSNLAHRIYHQVIQFLLIAVYLFVVFAVLALHEEIVAAKNGIAYHFYGFAAINAIILGKVMLVAEDLNFANRFFRNLFFTNSPLVYVTSPSG